MKAQLWREHRLLLPLLGLCPLLAVSHRLLDALWIGLALFLTLKVTALAPAEPVGASLLLAFILAGYAAPTNRDSASACCTADSEEAA